MAAREVRASLREIQDNLLCPVCLEMMSNPSSTPCGHTFCQVCIEHAISSVKRPKCPICKTKVSKRGLQENLYLNKVVEATRELEKAIASDSGVDIECSSPDPVHRHEGSTGTPGILLHQRLHPTPHKY